MDDLEAIGIFIDEIESLGYEVETSEGSQEHDPELVVIESWSSDRVIRENSTFKGAARDEAGQVLGEEHHFYYEMDVEIEINSENETTVHQVRKAIKRHFRKYENNPEGFHTDTMFFTVGEGGKREPFMESISLNNHKAAQNISLSFVDRDVLVEDIEELAEIKNNREIR